MSKANGDGFHVEYVVNISTMMKNLFDRWRDNSNEYMIPWWLGKIKWQALEIGETHRKAWSTIKWVIHRRFDLCSSKHCKASYLFSIIQDKDICYIWWSFYWKLAIYGLFFINQEQAFEVFFKWWFNIDVEAKLSMARIDEEITKGLERGTKQVARVKH